MLSATRKFSKSPFAWALFGLLILSFLIFGIGDVFTRQFSQDVIIAGDRHVKPATFLANFERVTKQITEEQKRPVSREEILAAGIHDQLLESMSMRESIGEATERLNVRPSAGLIAKELEKIPAFFSQLTGKFDRDAYRSGVGQFGYSVQDFERVIGDELAEQTLVSGIQAGAAPPRVYGALVALNQFENRTLDYIFLDARKASEPATPTEAQLTAFMNEAEVAARLKKAETRDLSIVRFSTKDAAPKTPISEADLKTLYDFRLPAMSDPELRSFIQIPAKDAAGAKAASDRLAKGEDPTAIAKALGVTPVVYDQKPKTAIADAKIRDAAFALQAGQVSGAIQGTLGYAAVKVTAITPGKAPTFAELRPQLEMEKRREIAQQAVSDAAEKYQKAQEGGADLATAAKAAGVTPMLLTAVTPDQAMPAAPGRPAPRAGLSPKLVQNAFGLSQGGESDIEQDADGEYYVVRVEKITPAAMPTLNEVRDTVLNAYLARSLQETLKKQADAMAEKIRKGESIQAVAAAAGMTASKIENITFGSEKQYGPILGQEGLDGLFRGKPGDVFTGRAGQPGFIVGKVTAVKSGDMTEMARSVDSHRARMAQQMSTDLMQMVAVNVRKILKTEVNRDRAHTALGIEAEPGAPGAPAAPAKKDKAG